MKKELITREVRVSYNPLPDGTLYFVDLPYIQTTDFLDAAEVIAKSLVYLGQIFYNIRPQRIMLKFPPDYDAYETILDFIASFNRNKKRPFNIQRKGEWKKVDWTLYSHGERTASLDDVITPYCTPD